MAYVPAVSEAKQRKEDQWSWVEIGEPFPDGPMRVKGEQNQYVALWYKNGKPLCGHAWNNGGVVECSFAFAGKELTGKKDLGGKIQILSYETWKDLTDAWKECGYWYEWVAWKDRRKDNCQVVKCGDVSPIIMPGKDGNNYCGNVNATNDTVWISYDGKFEERTTKVDELLTIVRNYTDPSPPPPPPPPPPGLPAPPPAPEPPKIYDDIWTDLREGDDWARVRHQIDAMGRPLKGIAGPRGSSSVALWYQHGQPVMGAIWNDGGKLNAAFGWGGHEYLDKIGSLQVLAYDPSRAGFKISWETYATATKKGSGWRAVKVKDCAPCVITDKDGIEHLGRVQMSEEKAAYPYQGKEHVFVGPQVQQFMVLCRTD